MKTYIAFLCPAEEGGFYAIVPDADGCCSEGETEEEATAMITEALELYVEELGELPKAHDLAYFKDSVLRRYEIPTNAIAKKITVNLPALEVA
jgi:predicted RNase H-like HicB family nuclease